MNEQPASIRLSAALRGPGAQPVMGVYSLFLGGALLEVQAPLQANASVILDLMHPALGALAIQSRVAWCRPLPDVRYPVVALEFQGNWDGLIALRHQLAAYLGSRVFDGTRFVGYVLKEPNDPARSCFDVSTAKIALILPLQDNKGYSVRWRDAPPGAPMPIFQDEAQAMQAAFGLAELPVLNVPAGSARFEKATLQQRLAQEAPASEPEDDAIYGMNTVVVEPDKLAVGGDDEKGMTEAEILGAHTMVIQPEKSPLKDDDSRILGAGRVFTQSATRHPHSKVIVGKKTVAYVSRTAADASFNLYDVDGNKLALLADPGTGTIQVCMMGDKTTDSLEFFTADSFADGIAVALDLPGQPQIDPPLEGI